MQTPDPPTWRADFADTQQRFETWRAGRVRGARIPVELWEAALSLAGRHGVAKAASTLKLDYYAVKRRLGNEATTISADDTEVVPAEQPRFVELPRPSALAGTSSGITCTIEIEGRTDGPAKLRLELAGLALDDLDRVLRSVWSMSA
ncbi:MAG TPA: hypothetical protein VGB13_04050 [Candidatus Krumholzibacteria bacterium]|jgi:hypothetical protein